MRGQRSIQATQELPAVSHGVPVPINTLQVKVQKRTPFCCVAKLNVSVEKASKKILILHTVINDIHFLKTAVFSCGNLHLSYSF